MKILAIRIKNLASLEGETEIDFTQEPLKSAGIFAITGPTGAGKSTILDALCLALYGKTPRYIQAKEMGIDIIDVKGSTISQGDVRGILRDGTGEGMAQVDFLAVTDDIYRATWQVRRARNKADGNIQADTIQLFNITENQEIPGKKSEIYPEIERLVGLNFEQFTRSVLLAQGDFTAFLKAGKDEKSALLEKLTGTHIYSEISRKIYERHKLEEQNLREIDLRKEGISIKTEEEVNSLVAESETLGENIQSKSREVDILANEINWHQQAKSLEQRCETADQTLKEKISLQEETKNRKAYLATVVKVERKRNWFEEDSRLQQQILQIDNSLELSKKIIEDSQKQKGDLNSQLRHIEEILKAKKIEFTALTPILEDVRTLDSQIIEKDNVLNKSSKELEIVSNKYDDCETDFKKAFDAIELISTDIKNIEDWQQNNIERQPLVDNLNLILSKLKDADQILDKIKDVEEELNIVRGKIADRAAEKVDLEKQHSKDKERLEQVRSQNEKIRISLNEIPIDQIRKERGILDEELAELIEAKAFWLNLCVNFSSHENLLKNQETDKAKLIQNESILVQLRKELSAAEVRKQSSTEILDKARLAAGENVESLRENLNEGEPCPVCGSLEHPYKNENPHGESILAELEKIKTENEAAYFKLIKEVSQLEIENRNLSDTIAKREKENNLLDSELKLKWTSWEGFSVSNLCKEIHIDEREAWLSARLSENKSKLKSLQNEISSYESKKQSLEVEEKEHDKLKQNVDSLNNSLKDINRNQQILLQQEAGLSKNLIGLSASLEEISTGLSVFFIASNWMEKWQQAPDRFVKQLQDFANLWKANMEKLEDSKQRVNRLKASIQEIEKQRKLLNQDLTVKRSAHSNENAEFLNLKERRQTFFDGRAVKDVEDEFKKVINKLEIDLEEQKASNQKLDLELARLNTGYEKTIEEKQRIEKEVLVVSKKITDFVEEFNKDRQVAFDRSQMEDLLRLGADWIENEREYLKKIDDEVVKSTTILKEMQELLQDHISKKNSELSLEEVQSQQVKLKEELETMKQAHSKIIFDLENDKTAKKRIGDLLKILEKQRQICEEWGRLNEIIGSADGKKFRQIAQEYTLDFLLGYANVHLAALSSRYIIQRIPSTLGLQVIDQDMGDEVRTVYSLSGGESFLISLALALGLASISSSRMKVESLFIDEGFGSLDPNTLNIVMDALERLYNQGRKVGVISHVQEMTERIPVQIRVDKMNSGRSSVEVVNA